MNQNPATSSYLTLHSPRGACAHFALGQFEKGGGFGLQDSIAASDDVYIGLRRGNQITCLPFFEQATSADLETFLGEQTQKKAFDIVAFPAADVQRSHQWGSDHWAAPGIEFTLFTPVDGIPDPATADPASFKQSINPAIMARLTIDNRNSSEAVQGFFAVTGFRGLRELEKESGGSLMGWVGHRGFGFACLAQENPNVRAVSHWDLSSLFTPPNPIPFQLGGMATLLVDVPAGEIQTIEFALGWYFEGSATFGPIHCEYAYTQHFSNLCEVLETALTTRTACYAEAERANQRLSTSRLNSDQRFMIAQATSAYWASSMLFSGHEQLRWVVNEGSFMMLNTFDLAVDHLFFELRQHPWVVKNVLDGYVKEYSYHDQVHFPDDDTLYPGGISFTHDQGSFNTFSPFGYSSYEITNQPGCYSYMTQEQLINWIVCADTYLHHTQDTDWMVKNQTIFEDCLTSMLNRDHPDPVLRNGVMSLDSSRTGSTEEITTYDSLDPSLGQARENLYLAGKGWAAYLALEKIFKQFGQPELAQQARQAADRAAKTITSHYDEALGFIPAIMDDHDQSPIIPAIEGLIFPLQMGLPEMVAPDGPYAKMIEKLTLHTQHILKPGVCMFADHSWKLSANSNNSWISKVFLCQHIARQILGLEFGEEEAIHDRAHADWWRVGSAPNPGIDQIFSGKTSEIGFFYPRAVTSILWLDE